MVRGVVQCEMSPDTNEKARSERNAIPAGLHSVCSAWLCLVVSQPHGGGANLVDEGQVLSGTKRHDQRIGLCNASRALIRRIKYVDNGISHRLTQRFDHWWFW
jgi:hypothetical protein